ncbi:methylated-DNA--[protein]-cysteine S-methyltransferase [Hydrogenophaga sp. 5NK40-0174]|uniref:methylated-DNA--[protein]-cysteine S-methyltransferase n=1 Tax=Hydrogenophaga sp. 5NK40-0174 TaxID=3127649 RepID=UPI003101DB25
MSKMPSERLCCREVPTPLGPVWIVASELGLCGLWFTDQKHAPDADERAKWSPVPPGHDLIDKTEAALNAYFVQDVRFPGFELPLDLTRGTPFQQQVWKALVLIEPGAHTSYGELARRLGNPKAVRAVGAAVGRNPVSIIVPCHRVLGKGGQLTGYAGGLDRKRHLLSLEALRRRADADADAEGQEISSAASSPVRHPGVSISRA